MMWGFWSSTNLPRKLFLDDNKRYFTSPFVQRPTKLFFAENFVRCHVFGYDFWFFPFFKHPTFPAKAYQEICFEMWTTQVNARTYHAYLDEDAMGAVKAICKRTRRALMEVRVMGRILLGLKVSGSYVGVL